MFEASRQRDVRDAFQGVESEAVGRFAQTGQLDISIGRDPDIVGELAKKMKFREVCDPTESSYRKRFVQMSINEIEHPAKALGVR